MVTEDCVLQSIDACIEQYKDYIEQLIKLFLKNFAEGFSKQKGEIVGFGPHADEDQGNLLKITSVSETDIKNLTKCQCTIQVKREVLDMRTMNYIFEKDKVWKVYPKNYSQKKF